MKAKLRFIVPIIFLICLFGFSLFNKGLWFTPVQTYTLTVALLIIAFLVAAMHRGSLTRFPMWLIAGMGFAVYTLICTLWAAAPSSAVQGALVVVTSTGVGLYVWLQKREVKYALIHIMLFFGAAVYLFGLGVGTNLWSFPSAVVQNQMNSVFQYHNAFGAFELSMFSIGLVLFLTKKTWWGRALTICATSLSLIGVVSSYSRLVWILAPVVIVLYLLIAYIQKKFTASIYTLIYSLAVALISAPFAIPAMDGSKGKLLIELALVIGLPIAFAFLHGWLMKLSNSKAFRFAFTIVVGIVTIAAIVFLVHHESGKLNSLVSRANSIDFKDFSVRQRFLWYHDAINMWLTSPIFGSGWGTWAAKFQAIQRYPYWSTQAHSVIVDVLVSTGIIGFLIWVVTLASGFVKSFKAILVKDEHSLVAGAAFLGAVPLFLHATFDFDWSFPVVMMSFYLLLGVATVRSAGTESADDKVRTSAIFEGLSIATMTISVPVSLVLGLMLSVSQTAYNQAMVSPDNRQTLLETAAKWAPFDPAPHAQLAQIYVNVYQQIKDTKSLNLAWNEIQAAHRDAMWDPGVQAQIASIAYYLGQSQVAYNWAERAYSDGRFRPSYVSAYMGVGLWTGVTSYAQNPAGAKQILQNVVATYNAFQADQQTVSAYNKKGFPPEYDVTPTAQLQAYTAAADFALGRYTQSLAVLQNVPSTGQDAATVGLINIVKLSANERLKDGQVDQTTKQEIMANAVLKQEYAALNAIKTV